MSSRQPESLHDRLMRAFREGFVSAFDFGVSLADELAALEHEREFEADAESLAGDTRKVIGDLRKAERRVHEQG